MRTSFIAASLACLSQAGDVKKAMTGTNIGGWQVLEPWITPSLFYRFLGKTHSEGVGMDSYTFCEALGPDYGNQVMRAHWDAWVTEDHIKQLSERDIEIVRLPIGDWTLKPYGPYVGCMDGAKEKIQWLLDTAAKYDIKVLLDVHAVKGSQNGYDNSGIANRTEWLDETHFEHWSHALGEWMGKWNNDDGSYDWIDLDGINWAVDTIDGLLKEWGHHPATYAIEPVNEPWWSSNLPLLKGFYRKVHAMMKKEAPHLKFVFHDAFHFDPETWNNMFADDEDYSNVIMDHHFYQAWYNPGYDDIGQYCDNYRDALGNSEPIKYDVWIGEWALATDVCALWLGGFNDNNTPYAFECEWIDCPKPYLPEHLSPDFDRTAEMLGPYGSNTLSTIQNGKCPRDSAHFPEADIMRLGQCATYVMDDMVQGMFMWTFRNELEDKWNYITAFDKGWIKRTTFPPANTEFLQ